MNRRERKDRKQKSEASADALPVLITGGAGFIGTNLAHEYLASGKKVIVYDNLSRPGVEMNLRWLKETHDSNLEVIIADIRDRITLEQAVRKAGRVYHLSAQVAVTTSIDDPIDDFEINLRGTLNVLEAMRAMECPPFLVFTSTNKVYGKLEDIELTSTFSRYEPVDEPTRRSGIDESRPLDFHSPYGCSKGAADQYVLDYARIYDLPTVVFRMSCIYGPHQHGTEDQGWVAHFLISALNSEPITLYGDGRQVRDILYVEDLVKALVTAADSIQLTRGRVFNIGGGPENTASPREILDLIKSGYAINPRIDYGFWRKGDQRYYVSNTSAFNEITGWKPTVGKREGMERLVSWLIANGKTRIKQDRAQEVVG